MQKFSKSLANAFPGAILTAVVWYFVNGFTKQKGLGFFDRQPWPINNIYLCASIGAIFAVVASWIALQFAARRNSAMEAAAGLLGLRYRRDTNRKSLGVSGQLHILDDWEAGTNLLHGEFDGTAVQVFDFVREYTSSSRHSSSGSRETHTTTERQTVFLLPIPDETGVPVQILKKNSLSWLIGAMGFDGVEFSTDDHFASEQDCAALQRFNDEWLVIRGLSRKGIASGKTSDAAIDDVLRQLEQQISLTFLRELLAEEKWSVEICESHVAVWIHKKRVSPNRIADNLRRVLRLHRLLLAGPESSQAKLIASGDAQVKIEASVGQMVPIMVSGCLGMALAFAMFIPVFFLFVEEAPWIVFIWPFFGMAVVAGCVYTGTRLTSKWRKAKRNPEG